VGDKKDDADSASDSDSAASSSSEEEYVAVQTAKSKKKGGGKPQKQQKGKGKGGKQKGKGKGDQQSTTTTAAGSDDAGEEDFLDGPRLLRLLLSQTAPVPVAPDLLAIPESVENGAEAKHAALLQQDALSQCETARLTGASATSAVGAGGDGGDADTPQNMDEWVQLALCALIVKTPKSALPMPMNEFVAGLRTALPPRALAPTLDVAATKWKRALGLLQSVAAGGGASEHTLKLDEAGKGQYRVVDINRGSMWLRDWKRRYPRVWSHIGVAAAEDSGSGQAGSGMVHAGVGGAGPQAALGLHAYGRIVRMEQLWVRRYSTLGAELEALVFDGPGKMPPPAPPVERFPTLSSLSAAPAAPAAAAPAVPANATGADENDGADEDEEDSGAATVTTAGIGAHVREYCKLHRLLVTKEEAAANKANGWAAGWVKPDMLIQAAVGVKACAAGALSIDDIVQAIAGRLPRATEWAYSSGHVSRKRGDPPKIRVAHLRENGHDFTRIDGASAYVDVAAFAAAVSRTGVGVQVLQPTDQEVLQAASKGKPRPQPALRVRGVFDAKKFLWNAAGVPELAFAF
jgi:hypothetical protein